jgi:NADP-dependent aldehyde dehydrogenase
VALPALLAVKGPELAATLASSIGMGCGQFCTSPGVIVLINDGADGTANDTINDTFVQQLGTALAAQSPHAMLTSGMRQAFDAGVAHLLASGIKPVLHEASAAAAPRPFLAQVDAAHFMATSELREEVFGPAALIVRADSVAQAIDVLNAVGGSLTVTLWGLDADNENNRALVRAATGIAGRVLFAGVPTGVAVTAAQQHGGPWPSSTQPMSTSVGDAAMERFLRPIALQDAPVWLLERQGRPC